MFSASWIHPVVAVDVCPRRDGQPLQFVDVFDGSPEELAILVPDKAERLTGYWMPGYVYDTGRFVTIRCRHADGQTADTKVPNKVATCDYKIDTKKTLAMSCE